MKVTNYKIPGLIRFDCDRFEDDRGYFSETYQQKRYQEYLPGIEFVQDNLSSSTKGTLRGLHFQLDPSAQGKLVMVALGSVVDVCVDLRHNSPTFGQWEAVELSDQNGSQLYLPEGCAHGFLVLSDRAIFQYKCTNYYDPSAEGSIHWADSTLNIDWPMDHSDILLSSKDAEASVFDPQKIYFKDFSL